MNRIARAFFETGELIVNLSLISAIMEILALSFAIFTKWDLGLWWAPRAMTYSFFAFCVGFSAAVISMALGYRFTFGFSDDCVANRQKQ